MRRIRTSVAMAVSLCAAAASAAPQAIEIGPDNVRDLPGGREADGIIGDFVLRNDRIEAVISGNQHNRKANMGTYWDAATSGCVYDLTLRGTNNDQLTCFAPGFQQGQLSYVRVAKDGADGEAVVEAVLTAAAGRGLSRIHTYKLRDGWSYIRIESTYRNEGREPAKIKPGPAVKGLDRGTGQGDVTVGDGPDPAYKQGYAWSPAPKEPGLADFANEVTIAPGEEKRFAVLLAVGPSPAAAYGELAALKEKTGRVRLTLHEEGGGPVPTAWVYLPRCKGHLVAYPDTQGRVDVAVPVGAHTIRVADIGRPDVSAKIDVTEDGASRELVMAPASRVTLKITDAQGKPLPCKVQFVGRDGTPDPDLGPIIRAHGTRNQYQSENGHFTQGLPPGKYHVIVTRGIEYNHIEKDIDVAAGQEVVVDGALDRVVDTSGWISCDFHNHTTVSGDNYCGTPDRVINLVAEDIEFAPTTEHNRFFDWQPYIDQLGVSEYIATTTGIELTGGGPHLNSFPHKLKPFTQDNGAPQWVADPRINALTLRGWGGADPNRWVQINHPSISRYFNDLNGDGRADGGYVGLDTMLDGMEVMSPEILKADPKSTFRKGENWAFLWLQMLNAGHVLRPVVVSDAHEVTNGGVGGWRTYVQCAADDPAHLDVNDVLRNAKAGHLFVTTGPFLDVQTETAARPGDTKKDTKSVTLRVRVQCNTWTGVNRVAVLVNGRVPDALNFTRESHPQMFRDGVVQLEQAIAVPLERDAHLIVVAIGEGMTLAKAYGQGWQSKMPPVAFTNAIFVDTDGDGFTPNGDTLGQPYLSVRE